MERKFWASLLGMLLCTSVQGATVFRPTDGTVNFLEFFGGGSMRIGLFDDNDPGFDGGYLAIQAAGDQASFTPAGADYAVSNASGQTPNAFALSGSDSFLLAAWSPGLADWVEASAIVCSSASGSCSLSWSGLLVELVVDAAEATPHSSVPIPSSVYLFGSGMLGMAVVARRRTSGNKPVARQR